MPENVPLYNDMRVTEYLDYRAALKGVPRRRMVERVGDVKELCGLKEVEKKLIGALSKGYRQRVGLADALVHEPDLLILDEPTSGLDPNQIRQVRDLIKNLGKQHTILLSTHILPEVEMTCSRVIIINKGRIEACDTPENLLGRIRTAGGVTVEAKVGSDSGAEELKKIPGVRDVTASTDGEWGIFALRVEARHGCARGNFSPGAASGTGPCASCRSEKRRWKMCSLRLRTRTPCKAMRTRTNVQKGMRVTLSRVDGEGPRNRSTASALQSAQAVDHARRFQELKYCICGVYPRLRASG